MEQIKRQSGVEFPQVELSQMDIQQPVGRPGQPGGTLVVPGLQLRKQVLWRRSNQRADVIIMSNSDSADPRGPATTASRIVILSANSPAVNTGKTCHYNIIPHEYITRNSVPMSILISTPVRAAHG